MREESRITGPDGGATYIPMDIQVERCLLEVRELHPHMWKYPRPAGSGSFYYLVRAWFAAQGYRDVVIGRKRIRRVLKKLGFYEIQDTRTEIEKLLAECGGRKLMKLSEEQETMQAQEEVIKELKRKLTGAEFEGMMHAKRKSIQEEKEGYLIKRMVYMEQEIILFTQLIRKEREEREEREQRGQREEGGIRGMKKWKLGVIGVTCVVMVLIIRHPLTFDQKQLWKNVGICNTLPGR